MDLYIKAMHTMYTSRNFKRLETRDHRIDLVIVKNDVATAAAINTQLYYLFIINNTD